MARQSDLPKWLWDLVIALIKHEDEHADGSNCLDSVLRVIPAEVRDRAEAIRSYAEQAAQDVAMQHAKSTWDRFESIFRPSEDPDHLR